MRLTHHELHTLKTSFTQHFGGKGHLWLFGSRVDDSKRGGDIDLYIETEDTDRHAAYEKRLEFAVDLQVKLGLQKIDIVLNILPLKQENTIYAIARETGVLLI